MQIDVTRPNPWPRELVAGFNDSPMPTPDGKMLVFDRMSVTAPNEIYSAPLQYASVRRNVGMAIPPTPIVIPDCMLSKAQPVTKLNEPVLSQIQMQPLESYWFTGAMKDKVQGFVVKPPNFDPEQEVSGEVPDSRRTGRRLGR